MNEIYFENNESKGFELLQDFNQKLKIQNLEKAIKKKHQFDASGYTPSNKPVEIEIKIRDYNLEKYYDKWFISKGEYKTDTVMIENHKLCPLLLDWVCGKTIPLYVNFFKNGYVLLHNLSNLGSKPEEKPFKIHSDGYETTQFEWRTLLKLNCGWIYKKNGENYELVQKGTK